MPVKKKTTRKKTTRKKSVSGTGSRKSLTPLQRVDKQITNTMKAVEKGTVGAKPRLRELIKKRGEIACKTSS